LVAHHVDFEDVFPTGHGGHKTPVKLGKKGGKGKQMAVTFVAWPLTADR
jgi:hypothetical protein